MKQLNHFDRIYDYAEGQMDAGQQSAFEAELSANQELKAEYEAFLASQKAMEYLAMDELESMTKAVQPTAKVIPIWQRAWARAAAILLLLGIGLFWYADQEYGNEQLAVEFYNEPNFSPNRGSETEGLIKKASIAFELGHLDDAIEAAGAIHTDSLYYQQAQHIMGHAYFKMGRYEMAVKHFDNVVQGEYANNADYMKGYSLLLNGQKEKAETILNKIANDKNNTYQKKSIRLIEKNESVWRWLVF